MKCRTTSVAGLVVLGSSASGLHAFETRVRFVQRVGSTDIPIEGASLTTHVAPGDRIRLRIQFGVFNDAASPAPAGGILGWNVGSIGVSGGNTSPMPASRTPGRLAPFTFFQGARANGFPTTDPFTVITDIDNTLGQQSPPWPAGSDPEHPPAPRVFGVNSFASVYEISLTVPDFSPKEWRTVSMSGMFFGASQWLVFGTPVPPTPDENGQISYVPLALPGLQVSREVLIFNEPVPAPSAGAVLAFALAAGSRRRRSSRTCVR